MLDASTKDRAESYLPGWCFSDDPLTCSLELPKPVFEKMGMESGVRTGVAEQQGKVLQALFFLRIEHRRVLGF